MLANSAFVRHVIILKSSDTKKDEIPFGYIKVQAIVDRIEIEVVLQNVDVDDEKLNLMGVIKRLDRFLPVFFTRLERPQKMVLTQYLATNRLNMFSSGYQLKDIVGFLITKEKKGKHRLLLVGAIDEGDIYKIEKDVGREFDIKNDDKKDEKRCDEKEIYVKSEMEDKDSINNIEIDNKNSADIEISIESLDDEKENQKKEDVSEKVEDEGTTSCDSSNPPNEIKELSEDFNVEDVPNRGFDVLEFGAKKVWKRIFEALKEVGEKYKPFSDDKVKWVKIEKKDIFRLSNYHPFLYMLSNPFISNYISNEGFLVIGYRHSKRRDRIDILLPGEFSEENMKKSRVFGFMDFVTKDGKIYEGKEGYFRMSIELIEKEE